MRAIFPIIIALGTGLPATGLTSTLSYQFPLETQYEELSVEPSGTLELPQGFSMQTGLVFESASANQLNAETVVVRHDGERLSLWGGKISPQFGQAWDQDTVPIDNHAAEYEISGKLGLGGSLVLAESAGSMLQMSASVFQHTDQTAYVLSTELQTNAGISFVGSTVQSPNRQGQLIGMSAQIPVLNNLVEPLVEFAHFGEEKIASTGIGLRSKQAYITLQYSTQIMPDRTDRLIQASLRWTP